MKKGFTLLEVLIGIFIVSILATLVALPFSKLNSGQTLEKSSMLIVSVLDDARSRTLSSQGGKRYGVDLYNDKLVLLPDYATTTLSSKVGIRNININGGTTTISFNRLTGATAQYGSFEVYLLSSASSSKKIIINNAGAVEYE